MEQTAGEVAAGLRPVLNKGLGRED